MAGHVSPELLVSVLRGDLPPSTLVALVQHHLTEICPECRRAFDILRQDDGELRQLSNREGSAAGGYEDAFQRAARRALEAAGCRHHEEDSARTALERLLATPAEERRAFLEDAGPPFRGAALVELLLEASLQRARWNPAEAEQMADLAEDVLVYTPGALLTGWGEALAARCLAHRGNARRVAGDLRGADQLFRHLRTRLASFPVDDAEAHAQICSLEASLRKDQRRIHEAEVLLERAILLHRQVRNRTGVARALIKRAGLHTAAGDTLTALDSLEEAARLVDPETERDLYLCTVANRALCLCERSRFAEAERLLDRHRDQFQAGGSEWLSTRLSWIRGEIALGRGDSQEAERLLEEARAGFLEIGNDFMAALVSLDLALLYAEDGRRDELKTVAAGIACAFQARQLPQHELSALILFQQAVAQEQVTVEVVARLRHHLLGFQEDLAIRWISDRTAPADA